jgi:hypothetical protein
MREKDIPPEVAQLLSEADAATRKRLEPRVVRAVNACGCTSGAFGLMLGVAASTLWWLAERDGRLLMWPEAGIAAIAVIAVTAIAKLGGILFARVWLALTRRHLRRRFVASAKHAIRTST